MTLIAVMSGLVLLWYFLRAVERDQVRRGRDEVWARRDCGYADTPQGRELNSFRQWSREMEQ